MTTPTETRIYRLSLVCGLLATAAIIVPRFVPNPEGGFAAAANAVLVLLAILLVTLLVSIYLATVTVRKYQNIGPTARMAGLIPVLVLSMTLIVFFVFMRF